MHEYLSNGNLAAHLQSEIAKSSKIPWLTRLDIAIDTANALDYLHYHGIIHRNVKSSNILLDANFSAKVANLHLSRKLPDGVPVHATHVTTDIIGSGGYVDPEYMTKGWLSVKNDVYSFGVVLCELLSSKLAKYWVLNEEENLATLLNRKIENQALVELLDPRLGFQSNLKIKSMMTATAELAALCMQCPQDLRPNMEHVLEILNGIKQGRYETNSIKGIIRPSFYLFLSHGFLAFMGFWCQQTGDKSFLLMSYNTHISALKIFHHAELEEATNNFGTFLGKGGYGSVYYGEKLIILHILNKPPL